MEVSTAERAEHDAVLAIAATYDQQQPVYNATLVDPSATPTRLVHASLVGTGEPIGSEPASEASVQPQVTLPVGHAYYFIQLFDAEAQALRTVGSFFSKLEANVKASVRKHMQWPIRRDFLMWKRVDGTTVTTVSPAENFLDVGVPHGSCIIIGDKLSKDR